MEHINECSNEDVGETELYKIKTEIEFDFNMEEQLCYNTEVDISDENHSIKSEPGDTDEEQEVRDNSQFSTFKGKNEIKSEVSEVMGSEKNQIDETTEECEDVKQKQFTANALLTIDNENGYCSSFKNRIVFEEDNILESLTNMDSTKALKYESTTDNSYVSDPCSVNQTNSRKTSDVNRRNSIPNDSESLKEHFVCDNCDKSFHCESALAQHILEHPKEYNCTYCSYKTFKRGTLNGHINNKHIKGAIFNCSYCDYKTNYKATLNQHIEAKHTKNTVFNCPYCNYETRYKSALNSHINYKHTKSAVFNCSYCSFKTYQRCSLEQHMNSQHTKSTFFNCSYCSFKTYRKGDLDKHINSQHTKSTTFNCSYCDYKSYYKDALTKHVNAKHTKHTVYDCSYCSYKAPQKCLLNKHVNSQHTKSIVYSCSYCDYKSYDKGPLNKHINVKHKSSPMFNCTDCDYKTLYKYELGRHVKTKHS